jgi:hypothetical protein
MYMKAPSEMMKPFEFLIGNWNLDYIIPQSSFHAAATEKGAGTFSRTLNDRYVVFDYSTESGGAAHGIFSWDDKIQLYRYWWFENSGTFLAATCKFINENTLYMQWHDSLFVQTFTKINERTVRLRMELPDVQGKYELIMEVMLRRK